VRVTASTDHGFRFEVRDDGADFAAGGEEGHGLVNMRDQVGAGGGEPEATSAPGAGTSVSWRIPT
jgi:signal transduction histidine kinase